jgi:hypothetical protein
MTEQARLSDRITVDQKTATAPFGGAKLRFSATGNQCGQVATLSDRTTSNRAARRGRRAHSTSADFPAGTIAPTDSCAASSRREVFNPLVPTESACVIPLAANVTINFSRFSASLAIRRPQSPASGLHLPTRWRRSPAVLTLSPLCRCR